MRIRSDVTLATFYKIAGAGEAGPYVFTQNEDGEEMAGAIARYTGVDATTPIDIYARLNGRGQYPHRALRHHQLRR